MAVLVRTAALLSVFTASLTAAVVFQNVDQAVDEPRERSPAPSEGIARGRIRELQRYTNVETPAPPAEVRIVNSDGDHLASVRTDRGGVFQLPRPQESFSLLLSHASGGAAFGVKVPPLGHGSIIRPYAVDAILLPQADWQLALRHAAAAGDGHFPGRRLTDREIEESALLAMEPCLPIRPDGRVEGRLVVLMREGVHAAPGMTVLFCREGRRVIGAVRTNADGVFAASGLSRGYYALIGYGPSGFAAFAVHMGGPAEAFSANREGDLDRESTDDDSVARNTKGGDEHAAAQSGFQDQARPSANPPMAAVVPGSLMTEFAFAGRGTEQEPGLPVPQGGAGGDLGLAARGDGSGCGGGLLGNTSGLGAFIGTAGLIAGAAALAGESDRRQPVSPSR